MFIQFGKSMRDRPLSGKKSGLISMEALLGILFALIVIVPIILLAGKLTRLSDQAKDNFWEFKEALDSMAQHQDLDERVSYMLIMDDETMIASFNDRKMTVQVDSSALTTTSYTIDVQRPSGCTTNRCLCLIKEAEVESIPAQGRVAVVPVDSLCVDVDYDISYVAGDSSCGVGEPHDSAAYRCQGGWFIDRGMIGSEWLTSAYFSVQRRTYLVLGPGEEGVRVGLSRRVVS